MIPGEPERVLSAPAAPDEARGAGIVGALSSRRSLVPLLASTAYVAAVSIRAEDGRGTRAWGMAALALVVATRAGRKPGRLQALALWAVAITCASLGTAPTTAGRAWSDAFGAAAALVAGVAACLAIARIAAPPGLLTARPGSARMSVPLVVLAWCAAAAAWAGTALSAQGALAALVPRARPLTAAASAATVLVLAGALVASARRRRLELGVPTRARAAAGLLALVAVGAFGVWLVGLGAFDRAARSGMVLGAYVTVWVTLHSDAEALARASRRALVLGMAGGSLALLAAMLVEGWPAHAAAIALVAALVATLVGAFTPALEAPLRPLHGVWLDAVAAAQSALARLEPEAGIRAALSELRSAAGASAGSPELWTIDPPRVLAVDAAGYGRERDAALPGDLVAVVAEEPEATLRREVLEALAVRRPDLRVLARWMEDRGALSATVVTRGGEAEGLLVVPHGSRTEPLALEEARAFKRLADGLASVCSARATLARSMDRERGQRERADALADDAARLAHEHDLEIGRHLHLAARLARSAAVGLYSAPARLAFDAIERRVKAKAPIAVVTPSGVDPIPYLARAHIEGPRSRGPFVVVDGTSTREHDAALWNDASASPLALADRGMLVLLDAAALPREVQGAIARALAEKRAPGGRAEPLDIELVVTGHEDPAALVAQGRLEAALATRLADARDAPIALPRLRERAEDLRAIVTDRLAREGLRVKGTPVGLEPAAFALLVEHPFPGEGAELDALVQRLVASCEGDVVRRAHVEALDLAELRDLPDGS